MNDSKVVTAFQEECKKYSKKNVKNMVAIKNVKIDISKLAGMDQDVKGTVIVNLNTRKKKNTNIVFTKKKKTRIPQQRGH